MRSAIHALSTVLDKISGVVTAFILAALCLIIDYSVIMRSIFESPVQWQYELTLVGLCWATFIGMPMTFHKQEHLRLTFITDRFKGRAWVAYMDLIDVLLIVFLAVGIVCSISVIQSTWGTQYQTIPVSRGVYYLSFPIGCAFSIVHLIDIILNRRASDAPGGKEAD